MNFGKGNYKTNLSHRAVVGQITTIGGEWILRGCIQGDGNVRYLHAWRLDGSSHTGDVSWNLVREDCGIQEAKTI